MHVCSKCNMPLYELDECAVHNNVEHTGITDVTFILEFDWVILQPGMDHVEMNIKGIVGMTLDVFWKEVAMCRNFRSEAALACAKKVTDHHKGWTKCRIVHESVTRDILLPFVWQEKGKPNPDLSAAIFFKHVMHALDPNCSLTCNMLFEILHSVFLDREGARCGTVAFMMAGRAKCTKLWFVDHIPYIAN